MRHAAIQQITSSKSNCIKSTLYYKDFVCSLQLKSAALLVDIINNVPLLSYQ